MDIYECIEILMVPICSLLGVVIGAWLNSSLSLKNENKQANRNKIQEIYANVSLDIEKLRINQDLVFSRPYEQLLDSHYALIKLYASDEVTEEFRNFGSFVHSYLKEYMVFIKENNPRNNDGYYDIYGEPTYEAEEWETEFELKITEYKQKNRPKLSKIDQFIKPLQSAMKTDLGVGK